MIRAGVVRSNPMAEAIEVMIGIPGDAPVGLVELGFRSARWQPFGPDEDPPTITIPDDVARALLDALSAHYGGTGDTRALRRDYDAERARVDRLIAALTGGKL
jgi:hypothetical protein